MTIAPARQEEKRSEDVFERRRGFGYDEDGYAVSDGKPMAESLQHWDTGAYSVLALRQYFINRPNVYVAGNNFVHYREGNRTKYIAPDCFVWFDIISGYDRENFRIWEAGGRPGIVFEFTSHDTRKEDTGKKREIYEKILEVPEYVLFDPNGEYLKPQMQLPRLDSTGRYQSVPVADGRVFSEQLGLWLVQEGNRLRFYDPIKKEFLRNLLEAEAKQEAEKRRADAEAQRASDEAKARQEAEAENAALRAELEALKRREDT